MSSQSSNTGLISAVIAGCSAALASIFAKLAVDTNSNVIANLIWKLIGIYYQSNIANPNVKMDGKDGSAEYWHDKLHELAKHDEKAAGYVASVDFILVITRIICVIMIFVCNAAMWALFTRALNSSASSVRVTVVNSSMNFFFTALFGYLIFGEPVSLRWYIGSSLIVAGVILMDRGYKNFFSRWESLAQSFQQSCEDASQLHHCQSVQSGHRSLARR